MKHDFVINDDSIVNEYGYRVMTSGIQTDQFLRNPIVLYIHERGFGKQNGPDGSEIIGRVIELTKKEAQLIATIEFDVADEFAAKIAGKVERGFIRMASIFADPKETSIEKENILPGQIFETVMQCKLFEVSIVDIGGNDNALKLSKTGKRIKLNRINTKSTKPDMAGIKTIALALGMSADSAEDNVLGKVSELKLAKETAENRVKELENGIKDSQTKEAGQIIDKAVVLGLIPEGLKSSQMKAFEADFEGQKVILSGLIESKESEDGTEEKKGAFKEVILSAQASKKEGAGEMSFDYLQKHDPVKLSKIHKEQPDVYEKLAIGYANGVRHKN